MLLDRLRNTFVKRVHEAGVVGCNQQIQLLIFKLPICNLRYNNDVLTSSAGPTPHPIDNSQSRTRHQHRVLQITQIWAIKSSTQTRSSPLAGSGESAFSLPRLRGSSQCLMAATRYVSFFIHRRTLSTLMYICICS